MQTSLGVSVALAPADIDTAAERIAAIEERLLRQAREEAFETARAEYRARLDRERELRLEAEAAAEDARLRALDQAPIVVQLLDFDVHRVGDFLLRLVAKHQEIVHALLFFRFGVERLWPGQPGRVAWQLGRLFGLDFLLRFLVFRLLRRQALVLVDDQPLVVEHVVAGVAALGRQALGVVDVAVLVDPAVNGLFLGQGRSAEQHQRSGHGGDDPSGHLSIIAILHNVPCTPGWR